MGKSISFLLGAGFSAPMGFPTREKLGKMICKKLKMICKEQRCDDSPYNKEWVAILYKMIKYYKHSITFFDYEDFYDKIEDYINNQKEWQSILGEKHIYDKPNVKNLKAVYQLCISSLFNEISLGNTIRTYDNFLQSLKYLLDRGYIVNVHTLNHDLVFESFKQSDLIDGEISDGYSYDTIYKGKNREGKDVKIPCFNMKYDKKIRLYKLHGSFNQYIYTTNNNNYSVIKDGSWEDDDYIRLNNETDKFSICKYSNGQLIGRFDIVSKAPDFLTGKKAKKEEYKKEHYKKLLSCFRENLRNTKCLIIIGYSGGDDGINKCISKNSHSPCFVYDRKMNDNLKELLEKIDNVNNFRKGSVVKFKLPKIINF